MMAADSDTDDLTEEEEVEEKEFFVELDSPQEFGDNPQVQFLGLDQDKPLLNINGITYKGTWEDAMGTILLLEETSELESFHPLLKDDLNFVLDVKYKVDKVLKMSRCVIVKNREKVENMRTVVKQKMEEGENGQYSSEDENLDEYYSATIEPENAKRMEQFCDEKMEKNNEGEEEGLAEKEVVQDEAVGEEGDIYEDEDEFKSLNGTQDDYPSQEEVEAELDVKGDISDDLNTSITSDALLHKSQAILSGLEDESYLYDDQPDFIVAKPTTSPSSEMGGQGIDKQMSALQMKTGDAEPGCSKYL